MPKCVFEGFTVGVALIIAGGQMNNFLGLSPPVKHDHLYENVAESFAHIGESERASYLLAGPFFVLLYCLMWKLPKIPWMVRILASNAPFSVLTHCLNSCISQCILPLSTIILGFAFRSGETWELPTLKSTYPDLGANIFSFPEVGVLKKVDVAGFIVASISVRTD
jgi:MFS superfamily sulfate permease-like transporter